MKYLNKGSLRVKTGVLVILIALVLSAIAVGASYYVYKNTMEEEYGIMTERLAHTEAVALDKAVLSRLTDSVMTVYREQTAKFGGAVDFDAMTEEETESYFAAFEPIMETEEYQEIYSLLRRISDANEASSIYVAYMDVDTNRGIYVIDASDDPCQVGTCDVIEEGNLARIRQGSYDFPAYITNYPEYGWLVTAAAGVMDEDGNMIADAYVDVSMNDVVQDRMAFLRQLTLLLLAVTVVAASIFLLLVNRVIVLPINRLARLSGDFVKDGYMGAAEPLDDTAMQSEDEIGDLYRSFSQMRTDIQDYVDNLTKVTAEKERIGAELNVATAIQANMLPQIFPAFPGRTEFDIYATMKPAKEVGGDFYDYFLIDENHLALVMADVSGKGVPAALFMVIAKTLIKNRALMGGGPGDILKFVNEQLCEGNDSGYFVTVWMAVLDLRTGIGLAVNAGHEHPALRRGSGDFELITYRHSVALGTMEGISFREHEFKLERGDTLFVYTDGVPEATNAEAQMYGTDRMLKAINRNRDADLQTLLVNLKSDIDTFVGDAPQFDDVTMLGLRFLGK